MEGHQFPKTSEAFDKFLNMEWFFLKVSTSFYKILAMQYVSTYFTTSANLSYDMKFCYKMHDEQSWKIESFSLSLCFLWREILVKRFVRGCNGNLAARTMKTPQSTGFVFVFLSVPFFVFVFDLWPEISWKPGDSYEKLKTWQQGPQGCPTPLTCKTHSGRSPSRLSRGPGNNRFFLIHIGDKHNALMYLENSDPGLLFRLMANIASHLRFSCILVSQVHLDFNVTIAALIILSTWKPS